VVIAVCPAGAGAVYWCWCCALAVGWEGKVLIPVQMVIAICPAGACAVYWCWCCALAVGWEGLFQCIITDCLVLYTTLSKGHAVGVKQ
jgi:Na+/alanine symporter